MIGGASTCRIMRGLRVCLCVFVLTLPWLQAARVVLRKCLLPDFLLESMAQMMRSSLMAWGAPSAALS